MNARVVSLAELSDGDLSAWRHLSDHAVEPNPFFDPDFVLAAATGLGERSQVGVLVVEEGEWHGCLPVRRYRPWHRIPLSCLATWRHRYCLLGTPLVAPAKEEETVAAMVRTLRRSRRNSLAALEWVSAEGLLGDAIAAALPSTTVLFEEFDRATLERRAALEDYVEGRLKSKDRREFRRRSRLLGDQLGGVPELVDGSDNSASVEAFLAMEAAGWKGKAGTALASNPAHAEFFREVIAKFAARGGVSLTFLEVEGTKVAATCDLLAGGTDFCFKVAYDEAFSRFAPGRDLVLKMIDRFHADSALVMLDSCTAPDNDLYNRLWRDRRTLRTFAVGKTGPGALVAVGTVMAAKAVRERQRRSCREED